MTMSSRRFEKVQSQSWKMREVAREKPNRNVRVLLFVIVGLVLFCPASFCTRTEELSLRNRFDISVEIDPQKGTYSVKYRGQLWLGSGLVSVLANNRWYRSAELKFPVHGQHDQRPGILILEDSKRVSGTDRLGLYESVSLQWKVPTIPNSIITGFRLYRDRPYLVFFQSFPGGFDNYSSGNWIIPSVVFPQFLHEWESSRSDLYSWTSGGMFSHRFAYGPASSLAGTVDLLLLSDADYETLILSPFANYLVATQQSLPIASQDEYEPNKGAINCGIEGLVQKIPPGFQHEHIMVVGSGPQSTLRDWGQALLRRTGKEVPSKYNGDNMKYPVYWDDYGAYYREHAFKEEGYETYEDIILGVADDAKKHGLRIGGFQLQDADQFRFQDGLVEPRRDLFPHGLKWLHEKLGAPLEAYIPWLGSGGPYRQKYPYFETPCGDILGSSMGDVFYSEEYWRDLAGRLSDWGDILLQQDFLSTYEGDPIMMADVAGMNTYFKNQARALQEKGIKMQYAMQLPRNVMESTENPTVVSLQGSWDHHVYPTEPTPENRDDDPYVWKHLLFSSAFYGAVGIWPSRDNIQTGTDPNAWEDVLIANLLGGEIQLGHRIGECNFELLRRTYREGDGLILKPDRPVTPLDRCYHEGCAVGFTESDKNEKKWFYLMSLPSAGYLSAFNISDLGIAGRSVVYNYDSGEASVVDTRTAISLQRNVKHEYFVIAPLFGNEMAVIGDTDKFITMAEMRVASVEADRDSLHIAVISNGAKNPVITGYSGRSPLGVQTENRKLEKASSLEQLKTARSGWYWNRETKLWYVKEDFESAKNMEIRLFKIF